ncbi:hypothetical protein NKH61_24510 [Mesorhizobium sp. M1005]|uniref:hypothetical protein n=1 Tax=unclassified Mesorhizobium TaxID=325217 RepID=UPI00333B8ED5
MMVSFGDAVRNKKLVDQPPTDGFDMLVALAARYEVDPADLLERLSGSDVLAKICRDVLGLPGAEKRRGRSRDEGTNWRLFRFVVEYRLRHNAGLNEAIREWVAANGGDNEKGSAEGTWLKRYKRQAKRWSGISTLQMLYMERPPEGT